MSVAKTETDAAIVEQVIHAFDDLNGPQPGFRPAHAKGILLTGRFTPSPAAASLSRAPHLQRSSTPVTVRFSDFAGVPAVPDNDPNASPRGMATRFHLAEHVHTDIIGHSVDAFPVRTAEEFVEFLHAVFMSGSGAAKPTPIETFLATHPAAMEFVQTPKPLPASFAEESFFAVTAYKFIDKDGGARFGRYRIRPDGVSRYLDAAAAAKVGPNFLFDEIKARLATAAVKMRIAVQVAEAGDIVNDSTVHWPKDRPEIDLGTVELSGVLPDNDAEQRHIIFDPIPRVDGIGPSGDPLLDARAATYLVSGRRRRSEGPK
jgi:catalase